MHFRHMITDDEKLISGFYAAMPSAAADVQLDKLDAIIRPVSRS